MYALRKKAERLGSVHAKDDRQAFKRACKEHEIPQHDRFRISVQPEA